MAFDEAFPSARSARRRLSLVVPALVTAACVGALFVAGCASSVRTFPMRPALWNDPDKRPFEPPPEEYFSPFAWDAADQTIFRPISRFFAVDPGGESINVNAMDEVPDSSWFENRLGKRALGFERLVQGPCWDASELDPQKTWTVTGAKPNGANPGFIVDDAAGNTYLIKFDGLLQPERATSADVIGSRLYWAAGYHTPCNRIVFFDPRVLKIGKDATANNESGDEVPMDRSHIEKVLSKGVRRPDGLYRASASLFFPGKPLGPWRYEGVREGDPNDVVPHEDRRDLRGNYVLASWINHFDVREQNTLSTWREVGDRGGFVRHNYIDFGDSFGSLWDYDAISRRLGHSYYLDIPYLLEDFLTLGTIDRPWDDPEFGETGSVFGYFGAHRFDPGAWRPGYPNPALGRMTRRDAAWMARVVAHVGADLLRAMIDEAKFQRPETAEVLFQTLWTRRQKLLRHWLSQVSPLDHPKLRRSAGTVQLCFVDLAAREGVVSPNRRYWMRGWRLHENELAPVSVPGSQYAQQHSVCAQLPPVPAASEDDPTYLIVDVAVYSEDREEKLPARAHLYALGDSRYRLVGLERPYDDDPP